MNKAARAKAASLSVHALVGLLPTATYAQQNTPAGDDADTPVITEVIVTALRSNQTLERTPAAVTVVSGDMLEQQQVDDIRGLQAIVPATRFSAAYTSTRIFIRGVGSLLDFYWIPELTASNFNGSYLPRYSINGAMFDIDSVQVLPGPQGVLYGRSAGGGAVLINSRRPIDAFEASGSVEYGNYDLRRVEGMVNVPMTEKFFVRAAAQYTERDGYQSFDMQGDESFSARVSALLEATDNLSLYGWVMHYKQDGDPVASQYIPYVNADDPWSVPRFDPVTGIDNLGSFTDFAYTIGGYELTYDFGGAELEYRGSVLRQTEEALTKLSGNNRPVDNAQTQYTQDLSLFGTVGKLELIGGASFLHADSRYDVRFGPNQFGTIFPEIKQTSYSVFAQGTYSLTPELRAVAGARWSRDSLELDGSGIACFAVCSYPPITFDHSWRNVDWKVGLEHDLTDDVLLYANVQTGYAPGTLNTFTNSVTVSKEIEPQELLAYTAGVRSHFGETLTLNLEGYHYDYEKLIIQSFNPAVGSQSLFNVPEATVYGGQLEAILNLWQGAMLSANAAYTHARYGEFRTTPAERNLDGLQMQFAPDWTGTVAFDQRFELSNGGRFDLRLASYFSSSYWGTFNHSGNARQESFNKSDASLTYHAPTDRWYVGMWIKNIENEPVRTAISTLAGSPTYTGVTFLEAPRTYGLKVGFNL